MTAKQLEQETGCKIMVRGKGSMRDKKKVCILCFRCLVSGFSLRAPPLFEIRRGHSPPPLAATASTDSLVIHSVLLPFVDLQPGCLS